MAKVKLPLLSGDASGKFGDVVFFRRGSVQMARVRVKPSNPNTEKQQYIRRTMKGLGEVWRYAGQDYSTQVYKKIQNDDGTYSYEAITIYAKNLNKDAWKEYVIYSRSGFPLKGYQAFASENLKRLMEGQNPIGDPDGTIDLTQDPNA